MWSGTTRSRRLTLYFPRTSLVKPYLEHKQETMNFRLIKRPIVGLSIPGKAIPHSAVLPDVSAFFPC